MINVTLQMNLTGVAVRASLWRASELFILDRKIDKWYTVHNLSMCDE